MTIVTRLFGLVAVEAILFFDVTRIHNVGMMRLPPIEWAVRDGRSEFAVNRHRQFAVSVLHGFLWHTSDSEHACECDEEYQQKEFVHSHQSKG